MEVTQSAYYCFIERAVVINFQRRFLGSHSMQDIRQFLLVAVPVGFKCKPEDRLWEIQRLEMNVIVFLRIVQHCIEVNVINLGDSNNVARHGLIYFNMFLALQAIQVGNFERFSCIADE